MLFRSENARLAVVGSDNKVQLRPINIGRDYGATLEILGGVTTSDQVVINPPDSLEEGAQVNIAAPSQKQQTQPQQQSQNTPGQQGNPDTGQNGSGR
jgi:hypothetical protein